MNKQAVTLTLTTVVERDRPTAKLVPLIGMRVIGVRAPVLAVNLQPEQMPVPCNVAFRMLLPRLPIFHSWWPYSMMVSNSSNQQQARN